MSSTSLLGSIAAQRLVDLTFRVRPDREFLLYRGQRLTRRQVFVSIEALAAGLQALGIGKGDRVATLLPACPEAIYSLFLPQMLGTVHVPLSPLLGQGELRQILADCRPSVVICADGWLGQDHPAMLDSLLPDLPDLRHVIVSNVRDGDGRTFLPMRQVMAPGQPLRRAHPAPDDPNMICYTSGTTGLPKGAVHIRRRTWSMAVRAVSARLDLSLLRCLLLPLPPHHYAGMLGVFSTLLAGGKVVLMDRFDPQAMLETIQRERVSQIGAAPTLYRWLLRTPGQERYDLSSVRRLTFSTEPCPLDLAETLYDRLGCHLENMYGTTESMLVSWTGPRDDWRRAATTVGRPVPGAQVRIVDNERQPLPTGQRGEIAVRTRQMMAGYYGDPVATAEVLDPDGWFYTGDVGVLDEDGALCVVDRIKDVIIRAGENIYPAEIERVIELHPRVRRAAVVGVPSALDGETIWAYLQPQPGAPVDAREVIEFCRGRLAPFKLPTQVRLVEQLPTTATGKIQKFALRELAAQERKS